MAGSISTQTITVTQVVDKQYPNLTEKVTVDGGENPAQWEIVKLVSGKLQKLTATTDDPYGIMAVGVTNSSDTTAPVFIMGVFRAASLVASDASVDVSDMKTKLRDIGIFIV